MFGSPAPPHDARRAASRLRRIRKQQHRLRAKAQMQPSSSPAASPAAPIDVARLFPAPLPSAPDHVATMQAYIRTVVQTIGGVGNPLFRRVMTAVEDLLTHASCAGTGGRVSEAAIEAAKGRTLQAIREAMAFRPGAAPTQTQPTAAQAAQAAASSRGSRPKESITIESTFNPRERRGAGVPKWHETAPRPPSALASPPSFAPQFEAHCCVANAFADLEEVLGRYSSRRAARFEGFLRRRPEFPVVLTRLPFVAVEQLLLAISSCTFRELFVWFAEVLDPRYRATAWRPPRQTFRRGGDTSEAARLRFEAQAPREAPDELLRVDQYAQPAAVTLSSEVNLYDWRGGLRVRSGRFSALLERLAAKYGPRGEDLLDLAYQLLARAAKKQTAFVAAYVGPEGPAGECPCGTREPAPAFRAQRVFEWRVLGRLTPPSCYQILTVLPLDADAPLDSDRSDASLAARKAAKAKARAALASRFPGLDRLSARVSATVQHDGFRSLLIKRFVVATEDRIGGRIVRAYLLGESDVPFVSAFVRPQAAVPPDNVRLPSELRGAGPDDLVVIQYELQPLRDAPWTNVAFSSEVHEGQPRPASRNDGQRDDDGDDLFDGPEADAPPCACDECVLARRKAAAAEDDYDFVEDALGDELLSDLV